MPIITVHMLTGRTPAQKATFIERLAQVAMETLAVPESAVRIILIGVPPDDWGVGASTMSKLQRSHSAEPPPR